MAKFGIRVATTADTLNATMLAGEICTFLTQAGFDGVTGMKFLFPCGDKAREELPLALREHGALVEELVVYNTKIPALDSLHIQEIEAMFELNEIACVTFFSPSAVGNFLTLFPAVPSFETVAFAAIGATTAEALRSRALMPAVSHHAPTRKRLQTKSHPH